MIYVPSKIDGLSIGISTMAIGSFRFRPGPSVQRIEMWPSFNGVLHDKSAKISAKASAGVLSTLKMHCLMERGLLWWHNRINPDTTEGTLLWIKGYFQWHIMIVGIEQIVHFPQQSRCYEKKVGECWMDIQYWISGGNVSCSVALISPPLGPDSKAIQSLTSLQQGLEVLAEWILGQCDW